MLSHGAAAHCQSLKFPGACLTNGRRFQFHDTRNRRDFPEAKRGSVAPEIFELVRRQFRIANGVLNIFVAEKTLDRSGVLPIIGELNPHACRSHADGLLVPPPYIGPPPPVQGPPTQSCIETAIQLAYQTGSARVSAMPLRKHVVTTRQCASRSSHHRRRSVGGPDDQGIGGGLGRF